MKEAADKVKQDAQDAAKKAKDKAKDAADELKDARTYAGRITSLARDFNGVLKLYDQNADAVRSAGGGNEVAASNALAAKNYYDQGIEQMLRAEPPGGPDLGGVNTDMSLAMTTMASACQELLVCDRHRCTERVRPGTAVPRPGQRPMGQDDAAHLRRR